MTATVTVTRVFHFCAAHRLMGGEGKCRHMHGHNYEAEVTVASSGELDELGMVIDFSLLDYHIGAWIDTHWDHAFVVNIDDDQVLAAIGCVDQQRYYSIEGNPTAEVMARELMRFGNGLLERGDAPMRIIRVLLRETPQCSATVEEAQQELYADTVERS